MSFSQIWFSDWIVLAHTAVLAVCGYVAMIAIVRIVGKRSLSKMNAFDLVVTVALGSMLATMILSRDTSLVQGLLGLAILVGLQFMLSWVGSRFPRVAQIVNGQPTMLFYDGEFLHDAMRRERVTEEEVLAAIRGQGHGEIGAVWAVVLETDASLSVISTPAPRGRSSLRDLSNRPRHRGSTAASGVLRA